MRTIVALLALVIVVVGSAAAIYTYAGRAEPVVQPVAFNHALHLDEAGTECLDCHTDAETSVYAGLPNRAICFDCHDADELDDDDVPEKKKLLAFEPEELSIPWRRVALTRPDVFFSHRRHVAVAKIDCIRCHRDQETLTKPPPVARLVMTMTECIDCHEENGASSDCLACHR